MVTLYRDIYLGNVFQFQRQNYYDKGTQDDKNKKVMKTKRVSKKGNVPSVKHMGEQRD